MRVEGFVSSAVFGAFLAIALVFVETVFARFLGSSDVLVLYLAACVVAYASLIARDPRSTLRNAALGAFLSIGVLVMADGIEGIAIGLAVVIGVVRSGLDAETRTGRALCFEGVLGCAALIFASALSWPGWLGSAAALWGFSLVQSLYFLVPVSRRRASRDALGDPFERARERLLGLLDEI